MSFEPPEGILDIGNATLRVGKLEVAETSGLNQGLLNIVKNNLLITENTEYSIDHHWGIKLPTTWVADFDVKGHSGKYVEFNFYNEGFTSNTSGYTLNFNDTTLSLRYDNGSWTTATIPTIVDTYRKVNIFFERNVIAVSIDGTRVLYYKHAGNPPPVMSRVISTTGSAFVNVFIEENADNSKFKNLRIVNGRFISDQTSNIAFIGGNLGVGVNSPQETLDIRGNMHFNRVSNVSSVSVDSNVVTEYTGPHDRPLRKYPEVALTANDNSSTSGYVANASSSLTASQPYINFDGNLASHWHSRYPYYSTSTGAYSPGTAGDGQSPSGTLATNELVSGHQGEWVSIELPKKIKLEKLKVIGSTRLAESPPKTQFPKDVVVAVSETGLSGSWSVFETATLISQNVSNHSDTINITTQTSYYKYFALIVKSINSTASYSAVEIAELEFYGTEEGDSSLDTTLKTVYNVPATTGTQLEVYYDAKDLTTMPGTVTDLAGGDQTGTPYNVTLDSTTKSFVFNGSSSYINSGTTPISGNQHHSFSCWLKPTSGNTNYRGIGYIIHTTNVNNATTGIFLRNMKPVMVTWGSNLEPDYTLPEDEWVHVTAVYDGTGRKIYVNSKPIGSDTYSSYNINASANLYIGAASATPAEVYNGSIANFRLFSKALNADQIKELYDYQKDYFLGSKSQVTLYKGHLGVGVTEPSGQLELAGDERIQEYPPGPMSDYETFIPGHGVFCAYASTEHNTSRVAWMAFNDESGETSGSSSGFWRSEYLNSTDGPYNGSTGAYISNARLGSDTALGEYVVLQLPYKIQLRSLRMSPWYRTASDDFDIAEFPKNFTIYGSNDGNNWYSVFVSPSQTLTAASGSGATTETTSYTITNNEYYKYFGLVVTETNYGNYSAVGYATAIGNLQYFGTPGPTTLDKGSLTLGRSLDVPRISRYDVDTETPRPEKIVLDFDTTKMYDAPGTGSRYSHIALDNSGHRRNGNFRGAIGNYYSRPDKAFKFIGDGYLQTDYYIMSGNPPMSQSIWFNYTGAGLETLYTITAGYGTNTTFWVYVSGDVLSVDFSGNVVSFTDPNTGSSAIGPNQWYHLVITYDGNSTIGGRRCYINGVEQVSSVVSGGAANGTLSLGSARVTLGALDYTATTGLHQMVGLLSNFKIYDAILEPSEVRKLYRLGRTGRSMVISDTAVGIGREPEVQLDVRGTVRFDNAYIENIFSPSLLGHQTCFGGGSVSYNNSTYRLRWSSDIVIIPNHHTNGSGSMHCRIRCPENGEAINHYDLTGAHSTSAVTSAGIYLGVWQSLWYTVSDDGPVTSIPSQFFTMEYYSPRFPVLGTNSILIAVRFADGIDNELYFPSIRGRINVV